MADCDLVIDNIIYEIGKRIYPVGSIYISMNDTSPATLFGGTWTRIYDAVLHAVADGSSSSSTVTGSNTVTLSKYQIPAYTIGFLPSIVMNNHNYWSNSGSYTVHEPSYSSSHAIYASSWNNTIGSGHIPSSATNTVQGSNNDGARDSTQWGWRIQSRDTWQSQQSVNILPKHLDVYMWRRTA